MRCLFCKSNSSRSRSIEHILPESLGNKSHRLPPGVVCDSCNNYFSHSIEKPFLDAPAIRALRFWENMENKRGRVPSIHGIIPPRIEVTAMRDSRTGDISINVPEADFGFIKQAKALRLLLPAAGTMPVDNIISRFLAKVALEAMAARVCTHLGSVDYLVDEAQLDIVRDHARRGKSPSWPVNIRKIYEVDASVSGTDGSDEQILHEWDFLQTPANEWYFVLALLGVEFTINMGGPDIDGYQMWLRANGNESPLYVGRYAGDEKPMVVF